MTAGRSDDRPGREPGGPGGLGGLRVLDLSTGLAGAYCGKLLVDAWADVVRLDGYPMAGTSPVLDAYLNGSKRVVSGDLERVPEAAAVADVVVEDSGFDAVALDGLRDARPSLVTVSISPFGRRGPWAVRPATEFTMQAECGSTGPRGTAERPPVQAGGRLGEWAAGTFAAVGALAAWRTARRSGRGEDVDVSMFEAMCLIHHPFRSVAAALAGSHGGGSSRSVEVPSIEPTADGYVGFCTITAQMFSDFCALIERPDLFEDPMLRQATERYAGRDALLPAVHAWTRRHTTAEVVERASAMRVPVSPIGNGSNIAGMDHFRARGVFVANGDGILQPRVPYRIEGLDPRPFGTGPTSGTESSALGWEEMADLAGSDRAIEPDVAPLASLRVLDLTAFWAGPSATQLMGVLGADVVKVESVQRPDPMRFNSSNPQAADWWEYGAVFMVANTSKRGITLDLTQPRGLELLRRLIEAADVVIENYTPRVMDNFGLTVDAIREINPRVIYLRMPAFGLDGPWRDRSGLAQTMEQVSGLAWLTGYADGPPQIPRGPCDPIAGAHAVLALMVALEERRRTGAGMLVEVPMVESILNIAAEGVAEYSATGRLLERQGNRSEFATPQGVYPCRGTDRWVAVSVTDDGQWARLVQLMGAPEWAQEPSLTGSDGRRLQLDLIDERLAQWCSGLEADDVVGRLVGTGIPAGVVITGDGIAANPQLRYRRFHEELDHPVVGRQRMPGMPFHFARRDGGWLTGAAPTLGQHNREILEELGLGDEEIAQLEASRVIGTRPVGV